MRRQEFPIGSVPAEAAADVIEQTAPNHVQERLFRHFRCVSLPPFAPVGKQKQQVVRRRELWRTAKAAVYRIIIAGECLECFFRQIVRFRVFRPTCILQRTEQALRLIEQRGSVCFPLFGDHSQKLSQTVHTAAADLGEIRPGKKRLLIRCHKDAGRPAAAAREGQTHAHIDAVNVRALLFVNLNGDKMTVQERSDLRVLKALPRHDVAPVTGAVADAQEHRLVLLPRQRKGLLRPGIPVNRIVRVLQ